MAPDDRNKRFRGLARGGAHAAGAAARAIFEASLATSRTLFGELSPEAVQAALIGKKRPKHAGEIALGVGIASSLAAGRSLFEHPGMRASVRAMERSLRGLDPDRHADEEVAAAHAETIAAHLRRRGLRPARIGVDGLPGSGKTTLARKLAARLGMRHVSLDHTDMTQPVDLSATGVVFEHHRLLRTQDVDALDALVYIDLPVPEALRRIEQRERGGYLMALFDFDLMKHIGDVAFMLCDGQTIGVDARASIKLKLRPAGGYRVRENLIQVARQRGLDPARYSREELMFLVTSGRAREGLRAYLNNAEIRRNLGAAVAAALDYLDRSTKR